MKPVLRRIAIHGGLTALVLGIVGFMFAELATIWLGGSSGTRAATGEPVASLDADGAIAAKLRERVPITLAIAGFAFVAIGELTLHLWHRRKPVIPAAAPQPDPAEKLLEEILAQVESAPHPDSEVTSPEAGAMSRDAEKHPPESPRETRLP